MFDGVEELDFVAPYEVFSASRFFTDRAVEVRYVTASRPGFVRASYGTRVGVEHGWAPQDRFCELDGPLFLGIGDRVRFDGRSLSVTLKSGETFSPTGTWGIRCRRGRRL